MVKKMKLPKTTRRANDAAQGDVRRKKIAAVIAGLNQINPPTAKAAEAIALFKSWLTDESGYDEKVWPRLKKALDQERERVGARRLFDA
jgi:hypothetical protein